MTEHSEVQQDTTPRFVVAKKLEYNPDINTPGFEIKDQLTETLPVITAEQLDLMGHLAPEELNVETLDSLGLPAGEGVVAVSVGGEKRYVNIGLEDYGTTIREKNIRVVLGAETTVPVAEIGEQGEIAASEVVRGELGETALTAATIEASAAAQVEHTVLAKKRFDLRKRAGQIADGEDFDTFEKKLSHESLGQQITPELVRELADTKVPEKVVHKDAPDETDTQGNNEQKAEESNELPEGAREVIATFLNRAEQEVDGLLGSTSVEMQIIDELKGAMARLRYGNGEKSRQFMEQQTEMVAHLSNKLQSDADSKLRGIVTGFRGEIDESLGASEKGEKMSAKLKHKVRHLISASDEMEVLGNSIARRNDELAAEARALLHIYDNMLNDSWGGGYYLAHLSQKLGAIEDMIMGRQANLSRAQNELPGLRSILK